jgi:hypothetical protein
MSTPKKVSATLHIELDFEPKTPSATRAAFLEAIKAAVIESQLSGDLELVVAQEFLAVLPTREPRQ